MAGLFIFACMMVIVPGVVRYAPIAYAIVEGTLLDACGIDRDSTPWEGW